MRWLFLLLLTLNILYYAFQLQQSPLQAKQVAPSLSYGSEASSSIALLSESDRFPNKQSQALPEKDAICLFLGGFNDEDTVRALEQRLLSLDIRSSLQVVESTVGVDYWVYLPPLASRQASLRQLRELQSRNIDAYIISVGDLTNGISLGIFSRQDSAEGVVTRLGGAGYAALVRELPRAHRTQWLRVEPESRALLSEALLQTLVEQMPAMKHEQMSCADVASSPLFE
ncbi:SPOR domain-containing protein [Stutzerimonas degradans]|uniref:Sporulation protein n=1 Tax=Stutzerimonas degradans TaxID=2968968 RepID=A0A8E2QB80_9GAMM|nr:SPOR domain-containing protein [Stutzerimonas degradans]MCQ4277445.1 SPOR domain-containing protein [Stutzerimonas degradans]PNF74900.1 sporulation protein [Stutzerimonas degradans]QPT20432.1 SPOR domain-containing protein [Stutzerimonas degradans]